MTDPEISTEKETQSLMVLGGFLVQSIYLFPKVIEVVHKQGGRQRDCYMLFSMDLAGLCLGIQGRP